MIFWYKDLYMDEKVRKQEKKCKKIIEERSIFQKLPWKKSFYIITLAENENIFIHNLIFNQMKKIFLKS